MERSLSPVNDKPLVWNYSLGPEETKAVARVMESRVLSDHYGSAGRRFLGGREVRALEREWAAYFKVRHAMAVNSASSGLYCALAALGLEPGDEVIVPPYTLSATVAAVVANQCLPVFTEIQGACRPGLGAPDLSGRGRGGLFEGRVQGGGAL